MQTVILVVIVLAAVLMLKPLVGMMRAWSAPSAARRALDRIPDHVHLAPAPAEAWADPIVARRIATDLARRRFEDVGTFQAAELPDTTIELMVHPEELILAALHEHRENGFWIDLTLRYADGTTYQVTSNRDPDTNGRPGHKCLCLPGATADLLHKRLESGRPPGDVVPVSAGDAATHYEALYAETVAWRKAQGVGSNEAKQQAA